MGMKEDTENLIIATAKKIIKHNDQSVVEDLTIHNHGPDCIHNKGLAIPAPISPPFAKKVKNN